MMISEAKSTFSFLFDSRYLYLNCFINPIHASTMCKNNIRKTKADKVDTL